VRKEELLSEEGLTEEIYKIGLCYDPEDNPSPLFEYTFHLAELLNGEVVVIHALEHIVSCVHNIWPHRAAPVCSCCSAGSCESSILSAS
jgi:hypothetical protein